VTSSGTWAPDEPPREPGSRPAPVGWPGPTPMPPGPPVRPPEREPAQAAPQPPARPPDPPPSTPAVTREPDPPRHAATTVADPPARPGPPVTQARTTAKPMSVAPSTRKGGRRARLTVKRIDPWSTLKFSFVYSLAGLVVLLVAVIALYSIVDAMGVIDSIRSFLRDVDQPKSGQGIAVWLTFGRVFTVALVLGIVNVILFTAFATLTAFVYNVCTDLVGGIEVTLAERG
jgi:Transmembrane domain of unknown function (DUF3566)